MKINVDLRNINGLSGISIFKKRMTMEMLKMHEFEIQGCYNIYRNERPEDFQWFTSDRHRSFLPEKIAYNSIIDLPFNYELWYGSKADLNLFFSFYIPSVNFKAPLITTIHDLIVLKAHSESAKFELEHRTRLQHAVDKSSYIFTVSESSKLDICREFNLDENKIHIIHNGINYDDFDIYISDERRDYLQNKYGLPDKFILYFGGYRKHKNIENLIRAYAEIAPDIRKEYKLVITNKNQNLLNLVRETRIDKDVIFTNFVDEEDKPALYNMAYIVYYASLYEGFGVPIIEAQASGVPVITSNTSSMPEASGGAAILIDPYSICEIKSAIIKLIQDIRYRNQLICKGKLNSQKYSWEKSGEELRHLLKNILI